MPRRSPLGYVAPMVLLGLLLGCSAGPRPDTGSAPTDPAACAEDEVRDGDRCVPAACGTGPWGAVVADVYADGSEPLDVVIAAHPGAHIALAEGRWDAALLLDKAHDGLVLEGRCRALVTLVGGDSPALALDGRATVGLSQLTVSGGRNALQVTKGTLEVDGVDVVDAEDFGVIAVGASAEVALTDVTVSDTRSRDGHFGRAIDVEYDARLTADRVALARNHDVSLFLVEGATADLHDVSIVDSLPVTEALGGRGIEAGLGAVLTGEGVVVEGATDVGMFLYGVGTTASFTDFQVLGTTVTDPATGGLGVQLTSGATLSLAGYIATDNEGAALVANGVGTSVTVDGCTLTRNRSTSRQDPGGGVMTQQGAEGSIRDCTLTDNSDVALGASDPGSVLDIARVTISGTRRGPDGHGGEALYADGGQLFAEDVTVTDGQEHAVYARRDAILDVRALTVEATWTTEEADYGRGVNVQEGAALTCTGCTFDESHDVGVIADGPTTTATLVDSTLSNTRTASRTRGAMGVAIQDAATVLGEGLVITGTEGPGVYAVTGGHFGCVGCVLDENGFAGVVVLDGEIDLDDTRVDGARGDASSGGGVGLFALGGYGPTRVELDGVELTGNRYAAAWLEGPGVFRIENSRLEGGPGVDFGAVTVHGNAVFARDGLLGWDGTTGLSLTGSTLSGSRSAILLHGASADLSGVVFADNTVDLAQQACAEVPSPTHVPDTATRDLCPEQWQVVVPLSYGLYLEDVSVEE